MYNILLSLQNGPFNILASLCNCISPSLTQVPVRQRVVIVVVVVFYVLILLALPSFVLQGDSARLVETRLDVLITIWHCLILLHITLDKNTQV